MGPWDIGIGAYKFVSILSVIAMALIFFIGIQPPNDWALPITVGFVLLSLLIWFLFENRRFKGPPMGEEIKRRQAEIATREAAFGEAKIAETSSASYVSSSSGVAAAAAIGAAAVTGAVASRGSAASSSSAAADTAAAAKAEADRAASAKAAAERMAADRIAAAQARAAQAEADRRAAEQREAEAARAAVQRAEPAKQGSGQTSRCQGVCRCSGRHFPDQWHRAKDQGANDQGWVPYIEKHRQHDQGRHSQSRGSPCIRWPY
jgi:hypothetical protein